MSEVIITALVSAGSTGLLVAIVNAVVNRKKLSAEATHLITQAAAGTVENVMKDNNALREKMIKLESKVDELSIAVVAAEKRERAAQVMEERWIWHLGRWHRHADRLSEDLRLRGGEPEPQPPLWPERFKVSDIGG